MPYALRVWSPIESYTHDKLSGALGQKRGASIHEELDSIRARTLSNCLIKFVLQPRGERESKLCATFEAARRSAAVRTTICQFADGGAGDGLSHVGTRRYALSD
jgi:hypothetical protein